MTRLIIALGLAVGCATAASATSAPTDKVTPNKHLTNGETVKVKGKGFSPAEQVYIVECNGTVQTSGETACDLNGAVGVTTTSTGTVPTTAFVVQTGIIGNGSCGTSKADKDCYIAVAPSNLSQVAFARIVFVP